MEKLNQDRDPVSMTTLSSEQACWVMQKIGLPALCIAPVTLEVLAFNDLFADLITYLDIRDCRLWFVKGVLPSLVGGAKENWVSKTARSESAQVCLRLTLGEGRRRTFEMRSAAMIGEEMGRSMMCVFISASGPEEGVEAASELARGQAMERSRIRHELHRNVSQKLLGAAFGCKLLAGRIGEEKEELANQASELAELLNTAVVDLQNLTQQEPR